MAAASCCEISLLLGLPWEPPMAPPPGVPPAVLPPDTAFDRFWRKGSRAGLLTPACCNA